MPPLYIRDDIYTAGYTYAHTLNMMHTTLNVHCLRVSTTTNHVPCFAKTHGIVLYLSHISSCFSLLFLHRLQVAAMCEGLGPAVYCHLTSLGSQP